jgi:serine phosphatase RsbU (regulator of sigma subunit)
MNDTASPSDAATIEQLKRELAAKQATIDALMAGYLTFDFPVVDGLSFDVLYRPAADIEQLGGDWYDVFRLIDGRTAFSLGDVCGRGIGSAVKMAQAKQAIKVAASLAGNDPQPIPVLDQANKVIFLNNNHVEFTTAVYGLIDMARHTVVYGSAGHHPPILTQIGESARVMPNHGFALGVEENMPDLIREHAFTFTSGMLLVLYTDGLIEFSHDTNEGEARLLRAADEAVNSRSAHPARFIVESVLHEVQRLPDDVAVLTIYFH